MKILPFANFQANMFGLLGFLAGVIYSFGGFFYDLFTTGLNMGTALAFFALFGMPVIFWVFGFLVGILEAILYNALGKKVGLRGKF